MPSRLVLLLCPEICIHELFTQLLDIPQNLTLNLAPVAGTRRLWRMKGNPGTLCYRWKGAIAAKNEGRFHHSQLIDDFWSEHRGRATTRFHIY